MRFSGMPPRGAMEVPGVGLALRDERNPVQDSARLRQTLPAGAASADPSRAL